MRMLSKRTIAMVVVLAGTTAPAAAEDTAEREASRQAWSLQTGTNVLELSQEGGTLRISKLGPKESGPIEPMELISASVDGASIRSSDLEVVGVETSHDSSDSPSLTATLRHQPTSLEFMVKYTAFAETGVFTCDVVLNNKGERPTTVERCSSLLLELPGGPAELRFLNGPKKVERQLKTVKLGDDEFQLDNGSRGRSTPDKSLWWSLYEPTLNLSYTAQMAYSGNWSARFSPNSDGRRDASMAMEFDNSQPLTLAAGKSFTLPTASLTISKGRELDAAILSMHRYLRGYIIPKHPENNPLLVQYNTWYAFDGTIEAETLQKVIPLAAKIGSEAFVIDANWYHCPGFESDKWFERLGDWEVDPKKFPDGLGPIIKSVHDHGMKFGLWFEPEVASVNSNVLREHPDWFLSLDGKPIVKRTRVHLDFAKPEVREHMHGVIARLMQQGTLDWVKLDYNIDIGDRFDPTSDHATNTRLHDHLQGYYLWLEELAKKYPDLIIENCASGGRRAEPGIWARTHTGWISDTVNPRYSVQCAWGALVEMPPEICNHWMVGDVPSNRGGASNATITSKDPRWWDFMFRIAMNGQYGVSSRLDQWPQEALDRAQENAELYKRIRTVLHGADVYHLTESPAAGYNPEGWMAIQYVQPSDRKLVVLAFRLGNSRPTESFPLRGLEPTAAYSIVRDGTPSGEMSGADLMGSGLKVKLEQPWYSEVIELEAVQ